MAERKVTAAQLLVLADMISAIANEAGKQVNPQSILPSLNEAFAHVMEAVKNAAFNEAMSAHHTAGAPHGNGGSGEE